jgi:Bifunctional DNA primase/polymerase, N-terminal
MSSIAQPVDSGTDKVATSDRNGKGGVAPPSDFDAGYKLLEPHQIDPNPDKLPPDLRDGLQAPLHARLRGFKVIPLLHDGTPADPDWRNGATSDPAIVRECWTSAPRCKVGGVTDGLVVLALSGAEGVAQYRALAAVTNTTAVVSRIHKMILFFFRFAPCLSSIEGTLLPGVDILSSDGYVALPSGSITDGCCWANRYPVATAPQWLIDQIATLAASQTTQGNNDTGAGSAVTDMRFPADSSRNKALNTHAFLSPAHVLTENAEGGVQ